MARFADILRYQLYECNIEEISIEKEVAYLNNYIEFLRIQKSYIVAIDKIQSFNRNEITLGQDKIPVSKHYKDELMKIIDQRLIKK